MEEITKFAPVLIPTLCRYEHFKRCVESLAACTHAKNTDLYIAFDYPLNENHWEGYIKIKEYLDFIKGFNTITIIKRNINYGVSKNINSARKDIFKKYDRIIYSEDDNEFSKNFLDYINKGLDKYENDPNVFAICGYNYPIKMPKDYKYNFYYYRTFSAWGYGIWKDRIYDFYHSPETLVTYISDWKNLKKIYNMAPIKPLSMLQAIKYNLPLCGDGVISLDNIKNNTYCVYPTLTKVKNWGHDGTGVNCDKLKENIFLKQRLDKTVLFYFIGIPSINDKYVSKSLKKHFKLSFRGKIITAIYYFLLKLHLLHNA